MSYYNDPICAMMFNKAICFKYVDLPLIFKPVMNWKLLDKEANVSLGTNELAINSSRIG
jgi:hypothetical protein